MPTVSAIHALSQYSAGPCEHGGMTKTVKTQRVCLAGCVCDSCVPNAPSDPRGHQSCTAATTHWLSNLLLLGTLHPAAYYIQQYTPCMLIISVNMADVSFDGCHYLRALPCACAPRDAWSGGCSPLGLLGNDDFRRPAILSVDL